MKIKDALNTEITPKNLAKAFGVMYPEYKEKFLETAALKGKERQYAYDKLLTKVKKEYNIPETKHRNYMDTPRIYNADEFILNQEPLKAIDVIIKQEANSDRLLFTFKEKYFVLNDSIIIKHLKKKNIFVFEEKIDDLTFIGNVIKEEFDIKYGDTLESYYYTSFNPEL